MKCKCKRLVALVLALAMCLSLMSATAWAAEVETEEKDAADEGEEQIWEGLKSRTETITVSYKATSLQTN